MIAYVSDHDTFDAFSFVRHSCIADAAVDAYLKDRERLDYVKVRTIIFIFKLVW